MATIQYIDGSNLLRELAKHVGLNVRADKPTNEHLALACYLAKRANPYATEPLRRYWFASYQGSEEDFLRIRSYLSDKGFEAVLFKKRDGREKGVDIALTKEMLVHAFQQNCKESILVAGDEDYVPLVNEVKRYGQRVLGYFFRGPTSSELILSLDAFWDIDSGMGLNEPVKLLNEWKSKIKVAK